MNNENNNVNVYQNPETLILWGDLEFNESALSTGEKRLIDKDVWSEESLINLLRGDAILEERAFRIGILPNKEYTANDLLAIAMLTTDLEGRYELVITKDKETLDQCDFRVAVPGCLLSGTDRVPASAKVVLLYRNTLKAFRTDGEQKAARRVLNELAAMSLNPTQHFPWLQDFLAANKRDAEHGVQPRYTVEALVRRAAEEIAVRIELARAE